MSDTVQGDSVGGDIEPFEVMAGLAEFWTGVSRWKAEIALSSLRVEEVQELGAFVSWMSSDLKRVFPVEKGQDLIIDLFLGSKHTHVGSGAGPVSAGVDWLLGEEHDGVDEISDFAGEI